MESIESSTPPRPSMEFPESTKSQLLFIADSAKSPRVAAIPVHNPIKLARSRGEALIHSPAVNKEGVI